MANRGTQSPTPDPDLPRIRAEFDRTMNTSSPNPRYGGLTPVEALRRTTKLTPKQESKQTGTVS